MQECLKAVVATGVAVLFAAGPVASQTTSLADALALAYTTHPRLRVQQATVRSADEDVISSRGNLLPSLSQSGSLSRGYDLGDTFGPFGSNPEPTTLGLDTTLSQQLWDGGRDKLDVEGARMSMLAARQTLKSLEQDVLFSTVESFMNVRRDQEFVRLARNNVRVLREQVRAAKDRFEVGEVTRTDVSQAQARMAAALSSLEANRGALQRSVDSYVSIVGIQPKNPRNPPPAPKIPDTAGKAEAIAIKNHPRIKQAQYEAKAAKYALHAVYKNRSPVLTGSLIYSQRLNLGNDFFTTNQVTAQVSGTMPIYSGGQLDSARRKAFAVTEQAEANVQLQGYVTRQSVRNAFTSWQVAGASIRSGREQVRAAQVAFDGVKEEAKLGARTTLDTLDAEQEVLTARSNLVASIRDEYVATYLVLAEMGLLTAQHLNLGVPIYNPEDNYSNVSKKQRNPLGNKRIKLFEKLKKRKGG
ncbi:MAG: TolC family outer membrane protein [Rhodobacteraceae bacterium]|nr:TolC family outer membrane protein [Paracoccaceae bacterium]